MEQIDTEEPLNCNEIANLNKNNISYILESSEEEEEEQEAEAELKDAIQSKYLIKSSLNVNLNENENDQKTYQERDIEKASEQYRQDLAKKIMARNETFQQSSYSFGENKRNQDYLKQSNNFTFISQELNCLKTPENFKEIPKLKSLELIACSSSQNENTECGQQNDEIQKNIIEIDNENHTQNKQINNNDEMYSNQMEEENSSTFPPLSSYQRSKKVRITKYINEIGEEGDIDSLFLSNKQDIVKDSKNMVHLSFQNHYPIITDEEDKEATENNSQLTNVSNALEETKHSKKYLSHGQKNNIRERGYTFEEIKRKVLKEKAQKVDRKRGKDEIERNNVSKIKENNKEKEKNYIASASKIPSFELGGLKRTNSVEVIWEANEEIQNNMSNKYETQKQAMNGNSHLKNNKSNIKINNSSIVRKNEYGVSRRAADIKKFITFQKLKLVRRILKTFERLNVLKRFSTVPSGFYKYFCDKSSWSEVGERRNILQKIGLRNKYNNVLDYIRKEENDHSVSKLVLFSDNKAVIVLKILVIISSILSCIQIPLQYAFQYVNEPTQTRYYLLYTIIPSTIFIVDIYVNFNLAYYFKGKLICKQKEIILNYFFGSYWFDLFAILLQIIIQYSLFTLLVRIFVLRKEMERILSTFQIQEKFYYAYRLIRLILELFLSCHILACTFILTASLSTNNWLALNELSSNTQSVQYLNSLYYIIVTATTIGYGDIHPVSNAEKIFFCVVGFITSGLFAYNISTISSIVNDSIREKLDMKKQILSVTEYMTERNISRSTQNQILQQLQYNQSMEKKSPQTITELMKHISENLKGSLFNEYFGNILHKNVFLRRKFSKQFRESLISKMKEEIFPPGSLIFSEGEVDSRLIYVRKGSITLYLSYSEPTPIVQECQENQWFGFEDFFTGESKNCSAKILDFTSIVYINRNDFIDSLSSFPRDKEVFNMIKDKIQYSKLSIRTSCSVCSSIFHQIHLCPYLHFAKKKEYIIQKYNYSLTSQRMSCDRRVNKYNSISTNQLVRYQLKNYRMTLLLFAEGINLFSSQPLESSQSEGIYQETCSPTFKVQHKLKQLQVEEKIEESAKSSAFKSNNSSPLCKDDKSITQKSDSPLYMPTFPDFKSHVSKFQENFDRVKENRGQDTLKDNKSKVVRQHHCPENVSSDSNDQQQSPQFCQNKVNYQHSSGFNKNKQSFEEINELKEIPSSFVQEYINGTFHKKGKLKYEKIQKKNAFVLNPETLNGVLRILPSNLETDQEFFQKYDGFKWENDQIIVMKSESQISQTSFQKFENNNHERQSIQLTPAIAHTLGNELTPGSKLYTGSNNPSSFLEAYQQRVKLDSFQQLIGEDNNNIIIGNEGDQNKLLFKIFTEIEQIKQQQEQIRKENTKRVSNFEKKIGYAFQQTFTLSKNYMSSTNTMNISVPPPPSPMNQQQYQQENVELQKYTTKFTMDDKINCQAISFGKVKSPKSSKNNYYFSEQSMKQATRELPNIIEKYNENEGDENKFSKLNISIEKSLNKQEISPQRTISNSKQNTSKKFISSKMIQSRRRISRDQDYFSNNNNSSKNYILKQKPVSFSNPSCPKIPLHAPPVSQQRLSFLWDDVLSVEEDDKPPNSFTKNNTFLASPKNNLSALKTKPKERGEFLFFCAFERQNNWKAYFPIYNLSYITDKFIRAQKQRMKLQNSQIPNGRIEISYLNNPIANHSNRYRRLSDRIQENKDRIISDNNSKLIQQIDVDSQLPLRLPVKSRHFFKQQYL